ncbi:alpha,alpha-phosphotrehalase, partial [Vibrio genomosp. F10]
TLLCLNNFYANEEECVLPNELEVSNARVLLSNYPQTKGGNLSRHQALKPYETRILLIDH